MATINLVLSRLKLKIRGHVRIFLNPVNFNWLIGNNPVNWPSVAPAYSFDVHHILPI